MFGNIIIADRVKGGLLKTSGCGRRAGRLNKSGHKSYEQKILKSANGIIFISATTVFSIVCIFQAYNVRMDDNHAAGLPLHL